MTEPEPMDTAQRQSTEYWNGYYQGKAAAMRNMGVIRRTELDQMRRVHRYLAWADAGFWLFASGSVAATLWAWTAGPVPPWAWMMLGSTFTMIGSRTAYLVLGR